MEEPGEVVEVRLDGVSYVPKARALRALKLAHRRWRLFTMLAFWIGVFMGAMVRATIGADDAKRSVASEGALMLHELLGDHAVPGCGATLGALIRDANTLRRAEGVVPLQGDVILDGAHARCDMKA